MRPSKNGQNHRDKASNRAAISHQLGGVAFLEKSYSPAAGETHCLLLIVCGFFWVSLCIEN